MERGAVVVVVLQLLVLSLCGQLGSSRPCPATAVYMHSYKHDQAFCVCGPGLECVGPLCDYGRAYGRMSPSFTSADVGFPASCTSCA